MAPALFQYITDGVRRVMPSSVRREEMQLIYEVVVATNRYSASMDDRATVLCFLDDQEIRL